MPSVYEIVTEKIMAELEKGIIPWEKPWVSQVPRNLSTGKPYRGINLFLLMGSYTSPWWLTFKQCKERGGHVKKGEKGTMIVFWKFNKRDSEEQDGEEQEQQKHTAPLLRYYVVFNSEQCEGLAVPAQMPPVPQIEMAEEIAAQYLARGPRFAVGGDQASYNIVSDVVSMPVRDSFVDSQRYYSTLFHELTHSTRHASRLDRGTGQPNRFGSQEYSKEELVAEMGAAMLCARCSIDGTVQHSASYIKSWLAALKNDSRMVIQAAAQAQKAADYIAGPEGEELDATHENVAFAGEVLMAA